MRRVLGILIVAVAVVGAGCTPTPDETIFAVAYTNVDGVAGYDEATDVLIAKLVDTNNDGVVSVGDTVITDQYPLDSNASSFGTFQNTSHAVTSIMNASSDRVHLEIGPDTAVEWDVAPEYAEWNELDTTGQVYRWTGVVDGHFAGVGNGIQAYPLLPTPSAPDTYVDFSDLGADNDESFLEIDISI